MADQHRDRKTVAQGAITLLVMVAAVALLAAPAMAVRDATSLTATAGAATVTYGGGTMITGVLRDTDQGAAVGGEWVRVEQSPDGENPWALLYLVTSETGPYATGDYSAAVLPAQTTVYRFVYEGTALTYFPSTSNYLTIAVKPALGKPTCPSKIRKNKQLTVKGSVKPGAPTGPTVKIKAYRLKNGSWVDYKTYAATVSGTTASAKIKISQTGKFKFKTSTAASASFASALSSYSSQLQVTK
jgi:hypothetical protein